ncbi:uncharacterized, partial [Tachysurus ichikawai]
MSPKQMRMNGNERKKEAEVWDKKLHFISHVSCNTAYKARHPHYALAVKTYLTVFPLSHRQV